MRRIGGIFLVGVTGAALIGWLNRPTKNSTTQAAEALSRKSASVEVSKEPLTDHAGAASPAAQNLGTAPARDDDANYTPRVRESLQLAAQMDQVRDAAAVDRKVDQITKELTQADAIQLAEVAQASARSHNARYLAVFMLGERPEVFARQLEDIGRSENAALTTKAAPHTLAETQRHFEEGLRFEALAALDKLNTQGPREERFFSDLQTTTSNPWIGKLAGMGVVGARQGKSLINQYKEIKR